jgi:hypothetical protein
MDEEKIKKPKFKLKMKVVIPLLIVVTIAALIGLFIKTMNGPAEGSVAYHPANQAAIKSATPPAGQYDGKYLKFSYPSHYQKVQSQKSDGYLDIVNLSNTDHSGKYISIGVLRESLTNDSGVNYRKGHPELYKLIPSSPDKVIYAGINNTAEYTGFIAHGDLVTTISITANSNKDLAQDFNSIANSLEWKQ